MVTIVVPVYNAARYITATIESVLAQTYDDWELILVDDASDDESLAIIEGIVRTLPEERRRRIRVIRQEQNSGPARARNTGLAAATGRYLAFLDADDVWTADKLEKQRRFAAEKGAAFNFTAYEFGDENAIGQGRVVAVPPTLTYREALSRTVISTITVMFDLEQIDKSLLEMPEIKSEDTATWWRVLRHGHVAHGLNEVTAIYRRLSGTLSANKLEAVRRIWQLYRREAGLSIGRSICFFVPWAFRATLRRL